MPDSGDAVLAVAKQHAQEVVAPAVNDWNSSGAWPRPASDQAGAVGLTGLYCPEELGGRDLSLADGIRVYEELGKADAAYAFTLSMHNISAYALCSFGSDALKQTWTRDLTAGRKLANFSLTEPQSGSDAAAMHTWARINRNGTWTINGTKAWVALAGEADIYLTVVKTSAEPGYKDMAIVAIPAGSEGLSFGPRYQTPSYTFLPISEMYLKEVKVPEEN